MTSFWNLIPSAYHQQDTRSTQLVGREMTGPESTLGCLSNFKKKILFTTLVKDSFICYFGYYFTNNYKNSNSYQNI